MLHQKIDGANEKTDSTKINVTHAIQSTYSKPNIKKIKNISSHFLEIM